MKHTPEARPLPLVDPGRGRVRVWRRGMAWLPLASALLGLACHPSHTHHPGTGTSIPFYDEREPNNDPYAADFIGYVDSDSHLIVGGFVDDYPGPGGDIYDHFEFVTSEAASFEVLLEPLSAWNDMALGVFDPDTGEMVMWIDDPGGAQWADFTVHTPGKAFVLVVAATYGYGDYDLELLGHNYNPMLGIAADGGAPPAIEPLDASLDLRTRQVAQEVVPDTVTE
ncbi:MAG: hypothetical protein R3F33_16180 [Planctomycetota bacterium]